jgi:hypothetical protein
VEDALAGRLVQRPSRLALTRDRGLRIAVADRGVDLLGRGLERAPDRRVAVVALVVLPVPLDL